MTNELRLIITVLRGSVDGRKECTSILSGKTVDWQKFKDLAVYHEVVPFIYPVFKNDVVSMPEDICIFFRESYYRLLARCQYLWKEFLKISEVFERAGICLVPIKGVAFLHDIYSLSPVRMMHDIDVLVKEKDFIKSEQILVSLGYSKELQGLKEEYWKEKQCHIVFYKDTINAGRLCVELHWALDFKREGQVILPQIWERLRLIRADGRDMKMLSAEDSIFCLALHLRRFGRVMNLKNILDGAIILNNYAGNFDWDYVLRESKKGRLSTTIYFFLQQVKIIYNVDLPQKVWNIAEVSLYKKKLIQWFIKDSFHRNSLSGMDMQLYLKSHWLLYDSFREPLKYIMRTPQEQFCRYYSLKPYEKKTRFLYRFRIIYGLYRYMRNKISKKS